VLAKDSSHLIILELLEMIIHAPCSLCEENSMFDSTAGCLTKQYSSNKTQQDAKKM